MPTEEFAIEFDNPTRSYFPGQNVTGRVIVSTTTEKKTQGLKIQFQGKVTVHWSEDVDETVANGDQKETRKASKNYDDSDDLFDFKVFAVGDGRTDAKIPPGRNTYPFNFALPSMNLPSSYVGEFGNVTYQIEATIKRSWKFDKVITEKFTVNAIVDLNKEAGVTEPGEWKSSKNFCCLCCASGPVGFLMKLPRKGYVAGEFINPTIELNNKSNRGINGVSLTLVQNATFFAQSTQKTSTKTLSEVKRPGVDPGDDDIWQGKILQIPAVPPTKLGGCRIIDVQYQLRLELHVSGIAFNLKETIPITIGTIPLTSTFEELNSETSANWTANAEGGTAPSAPPLYPEMPQPAYNDSFYFGPPPKDPKSQEQIAVEGYLQPKSLVGNVTDAVLGQVLPKDQYFVPKYVTYGWIIPAQGKEQTA